MNRLRRAARIAVLPIALLGALPCWLWLQSSAAAGGIPPFVNLTPPPAAVAGTVSLTAEASAPLPDLAEDTGENEMIPFLPAAATYPILAGASFIAARAIRRVLRPTRHA